MVICGLWRSFFAGPDPTNIRGLDSEKGQTCHEVKDGALKNIIMLELRQHARSPGALHLSGFAYAITRHFAKPEEGLECKIGIEWGRRPQVWSGLRQACYRVLAGSHGVEVLVHTDQMHESPLLPCDEAMGTQVFEIIKEFRGKEVTPCKAISASAGLPLSAGSVGGGGAAEKEPEEKKSKREDGGGDPADSVGGGDEGCSNAACSDPP